MPARLNARVVFFAFGAVGRRVVEFALEYDRASLAGVVLMPDDRHMAEATAEHGLSPSCVSFDENRLEETAWKVRGLGGNIFVLAWWPRVLKKEMLQLGQEVTLNLHPSLLPFGRGKDPNFWAIAEGTPFGVTIHHVTERVDAGEIAFQKEIAYGWEDTGKTLYEKATTAVVDLFRETYPRIIAFDIPRRPQAADAGTLHRRSELDIRSAIGLDRSYRARDLLNLLRARTFEPHPGCTFSDGGVSYEVRVTIRKVGH